MKLRLDRSKKYALVLEGGGAKGAYQIGVCRALEEAGIRYEAVAGVSVGALNGAMLCMGGYRAGYRLWENLTYSDIMDVPDEQMERLYGEAHRGKKLSGALRLGVSLAKTRGFDAEPLRRLIRQHVDEEKIRSCGIPFYFQTYSKTEHRIVELDAQEIPEGQMAEYLLASAYFMLFHHEEILGKRYTDGGGYDKLPVSLVLKRGYQEILAVRIYGYGLLRPVNVRPEVHMQTIAPCRNLGGVLHFSPQSCRRNLKLGYLDGLRFLYGLKGRRYYFQADQWDNRSCFLRLLHLFYTEKDRLWEFINHSLPALAKELCREKEWDYERLYIAVLEEAGSALSVSELVVYTEQTFIQALLQRSVEAENTFQTLPCLVCRLVEELQKNEDRLDISKGIAYSRL